MGFELKIRHGAVWGISCIVAELIFTGLQILLKGDPYVGTVSLALLSFGVLLCVFTFSEHVWGYTYVAKKFQPSNLARSTMGLIAISILVSLLAEAFVFCNAHLVPGDQSINFCTQSEAQFLNTFFTPLIVMFLAIAIIFIVHLVSLYRKLGILSLLSIGIVAFPLLFSDRWLMAILLIPSVLLMFQQSKV